MPIYIGNCARYFIFLMPGDKLAYSPKRRTRNILFLSLLFFLLCLRCLFPVTIATRCEGIARYNKFIYVPNGSRPMNGCIGNKIWRYIYVCCVFSWNHTGKPFGFLVCDLHKSFIEALTELLSLVDPNFCSAFS